MPNTANRANFSQSTRQLVAQRAGYRCSIPECDRLTVGPANDPNKASVIGVAAHIYSAAFSGKGPRGTGQLSESELKSAENAIWLCSNHAALIDKHSGEDYPATKLHSYKTLHETRIAHELAGVHVPFGWLDSIKVESCPLFGDEVQIDFAKFNLVIGPNSVGKTALCEWIASFSDPIHLERWSKVVPADARRLSLHMRYHNPDPHQVSVDFLSEDYAKYKLDGSPTHICPDPIRVIFPKELRFKHDDRPNDLDLIANTLGLHSYEVKSLCDNLEIEDPFFQRIWFEESEEGLHMQLEVLTERGMKSRTLRLLASSEQERLLMQLGIQAANKLSLVRPTVLCFDSGFWHLDTNWLKRYAEIFASQVCKFQTIASTRSANIEFDDLTWSGWTLIHLEGKPPDVAVTTGFVT